MDAAANLLTSRSGRLARDGFNPVVWGPDVPYDAVYVSLLRPTNRDLKRLSASGVLPPDLTPVTRSNYIAAARAAIASVVGPNYKVRTTYGQPIIG